MTADPQVPYSAWVPLTVCAWGLRPFGSSALGHEWQLRVRALSRALASRKKVRASDLVRCQDALQEIRREAALNDEVPLVVACDEARQLLDGAIKRAEAGR